jgi:glycerol-3-phosphate dehydrogenase (NAD(P)+)
VSDIVSDSRAVAEGVETAPAVLALARRLGVDMPICETVVAICAGQLVPREALPSLMQRTPKRELEGLDASATSESDGSAGPDR